MAGLVLFVVFERRHRDALVPMHLFASRTFSVANVLTLLVYGALGAMLFFLVLQLQVVTGWTPLEAGLATVPLTLVMLLLSSRSGALAARIGPRLPLTVGPVLCGVGHAAAARRRRGHRLPHRRAARDAGVRARAWCCWSRR